MHLFAETARILKTVKEKKGAVKTLVFSSRFHNKRKLYALIYETIKFSQILSLLLKRAKLPHKITNYEDKQYLLIVLSYEFFVGRGLDKKKGTAKLFHKYMSVIQREHDKLLAEKNVSCLSELIPDQGNVVSLPRYVRVNLLKTTVERVVDQFRKEGWKLKKTTNRILTEDLENLETREFLRDPHLSDVLVFPSGTELHKHRMCVAGEIILQDKASCFPAHVLNPPEGSVVIDCCAAPGNKTSHVASLLRNTGKIFAFDKDSSRLKTMMKMLNTAGVTNTETACQDFLKVNPLDEKYSNVEYLIVDPSCSGSGIVGRLNHLVDDEQSSESRLKRLSNFQMTVLKHALSFPSARRVVYSTCSVHDQENESVVEEVFQQVGQNFILKKTFPDWSNRGVEGYEHAQMFLRMSAKHDLTNGFFIACFERKNEGGNVCRRSESNFENSVLTRKEKRKLKKRAKKQKLKEERSLGLDGKDIENESEKKKKLKRTCVLDSSYKVTEMPDIIRVDNSSPKSCQKRNLFRNSQLVRERLSSVGNGFVRMFRKWKVDFTVKGNKACCIVECRPESGKRFRKEDFTSVTEREFEKSSVHRFQKPSTGRLTAAEKRKLKKQKRKMKKGDK